MSLNYSAYKNIHPLRYFSLIIAFNKLNHGKCNVAFLKTKQLLNVKMTPFTVADLIQGMPSKLVLVVSHIVKWRSNESLDVSQVTVVLRHLYLECLVTG